VLYTVRMGTGIAWPAYTRTPSRPLGIPRLPARYMPYPSGHTAQPATALTLRVVERAVTGLSSYRTVSSGPGSNRHFPPVLGPGEGLPGYQAVIL